ncbi:MAG: LysE family transporter [Clostridia bacterium]|nr:LysE family transporter [Clostridia bacterium]
MSLFAIFSTAFLVAFSGAIVPGPLLTITIDRTLKQGIRAGPLVVMGHGILEFIAVIAMAYGLGSFLQQGSFARIVGIVGGLVLLWFGYNMLKSGKQVTLETDETAAVSEPAPMSGSVLAGVAGTLSNPYWFLWWAAIGTAFITKSLKFGLLGVMLFFLGHILADFLWLFSVSAAITAGKKVFNDRVYRFIMMLCGLFLILLAFYFIWSGISGNLGLEGM